VLQPYTKSKALFHCPADTGLQLDNPFPGWGLAAAPSSYAVFGTSYFYHSELAAEHAGIASVPHPSEVVVLFDGNGLWHGSESEPLLVYRMRRYNILFADGHVESRIHKNLATSRR
jgi:prepilin-type processing-associated H-X9-DG protein